jgi:hypothetical protein
MRWADEEVSGAPQGFFRFFLGETLLTMVEVWKWMAVSTATSLVNG